MRFSFDSIKLNHFTHNWLQLKKLNSQIFLDSIESPKNFQYKTFPATGERTLMIINVSNHFKDFLLELVKNVLSTKPKKVVLS